MSKRKSKSTAETRKTAAESKKSIAEARTSTAQKLLAEMGKKVYSDVDEGTFPSFTFSSRSVRNIVYDKKLQQFVLGDASVKRSSSNIKHIRPFTQLLWLADFSKKLVDEKRTSTLRDVYYSAQAFNVEFEDQAESDELITDLEVLMTMAREGFNIYPEERSAIFGNMTIEYTVPGYEGKRLDLSAHPDGVMIGPALTTAELVKTDAKMVLAIEKGGLFTRFVEEKVHNRFKALLINTAGQPPRSTRYLLRRLNQELGLPVGILCDADPWGCHIAMVIKSGSVRGDEPIIVRDPSGAVRLVAIGEFTDQCIGEYGFFTDGFGNEVCAAIPYQVLTADEWLQIGFKPMTSVIRHSYKGRLYTISTRSGRRVTVTVNHSVFLLRGGEIVSERTSNISSGDLLVISTRIPGERRQPVAIEAEKALPVILHESEKSVVAQQIVATTQSSDLMSKSLPAVASRLMELRKEIGHHLHHNLHSKHAFLRLCDIRRKGTEGSIDRESVLSTLDHVLGCEVARLSEDAFILAKQIAALASGEVAFDPVESIEETEEVEEYVYDVSVPGTERFMGGMSGILLHNSAGAAHLRELTTPDAVWLGVTANDIINYKLPSDKLTEVDIKRLHELKQDPRYTDKMWHEELDTFLRIKKKSEQEAFSRYGLSYIVDTYLPKKLELMKNA